VDLSSPITCPDLGPFELFRPALLCPCFPFRGRLEEFFFLSAGEPDEKDEADESEGDEVESEW
jgi:hypothetical protein